MERIPTGREEEEERKRKLLKMMEREFLMIFVLDRK